MKYLYVSFRMYSYEGDVILGPYFLAGRSGIGFEVDEGCSQGGDDVSTGKMASSALES
jgi:hypothetical protein